MSDRFKDFFAAHGNWSQDTFGWDANRGPMGPLKHLQKEVVEALEAPELERRLEIIDCFLLVVDAGRRAGLSYDEFMDLAFGKLAINRLCRVWPKNDNPDEPTEHSR